MPASFWISSVEDQLTIVMGYGQRKMAQGEADVAVLIGTCDNFDVRT